MRMKKRTLATLVIAMSVVTTMVHGQDPSVAPTQDGNVNPLAAKQQIIRDRIARLEDRMFRLREKLQEEEPENAERLDHALQRSGELGINDDVARIIALLKITNQLDRASEHQESLIEDLNSMLKSLTEKSTDRDEREEEIKRLEEMKKRVEKLLEEQQTLRDKTGQSGDKSKQLGDAIRRLDAVIQQQQNLNQQSSDAKGQDAKSGAAEQAKIADTTKRLSQDVAKLGQDPPESGGKQGSEKNGGQEGQQGGQQEGKPSGQQGGQQSGQQSGQPSGQQGGQPSGEQKSDSDQKIDEAAKELDQAQQQMGEAEKNLNEGAPSPREQEDALEKLRRARHKLAEAKRKLDQEQDPKILADAQRELAEKAKDLESQMQSGGQQGGQQGGQKGGEQGGQQDQQQQTPGQQQMDQAQQHMEDATEDLDEDKPRDATGDQDKSIEKIKEALAELDEALKQLREEEQEEILRDLEDRFRAMLAIQIDINNGTLELAKTERDQFGRAEKLRSAELSANESDLAGKAAKCLHILEEEGTTVVFPTILEQLSEDMTSVSRRLTDLKVYNLTQSMQEAIRATLQDLVDAIEKKRQEMEQQDGGQPQQGGPQDQPLLPTSAELKLLKAQQVRVYNRTGVIETERDHPKANEQDLTEATNALAKRQKEVAEIATEMRDLERGQ